MTKGSNQVDSKERRSREYYCSLNNERKKIGARWISNIYIECNRVSLGWVLLIVEC